MYCNTCGTENPSSNNYCSHDGTVLKQQKQQIYKTTEAMYCGGCGSPKSSTSNYCLTCGTSAFKYSKATTEKDTVKSTENRIHVPTISVQGGIKPAMIAAAAGAVLVLLLTYILFSSLTNLSQPLLSEFTDGSFDIEDTIAEINEYSDNKLQAPPKLIGFTDFVMATHLVKPTLKGDANVPFQGLIEWKASLSLGIILLLIIPVVSLFISGILYRRLVKEQHIKILLQGSLSIAILYGLFLSILSLFSGFSYFLEAISIDVSTHYGFISAFIKGFFLSFLFSFLGMLFSFDYKKVTAHLRTMLPYGDAIHQGISTFFRGLIAFFLLSVALIKIAADKFSNDADMDIFANSFTALITFGTQAGFYFWNLANLGTLRLIQMEDQITSTLGYSIFSGLKVAGNEFSTDDILETELMLADINTGIFLTLGILLTVALYIWSGYRLAKNGQASIQSLVIYSLVFACLLSIASGFAQSQISLLVTHDSDIKQMEFSLGFNVFLTFIKGWLMAFIFAFAGSFILKWRTK